jgi:hypothetical protein
MKKIISPKEFRHGKMYLFESKIKEYGKVIGKYKGVVQKFGGQRHGFNIIFAERGFDNNEGWVELNATFESDDVYEISEIEYQVEVI